MRLKPESIAIVVLLHAFFSDEKKVYAWLTCKNLNFGNLSPLYLINVGRGNRVLEFIKDANGLQEQGKRT